MSGRIIETRHLDLGPLEGFERVELAEDTDLDLDLDAFAKELAATNLPAKTQQDLLANLRARHEKPEAALARLVPAKEPEPPDPAVLADIEARLPADLEGDDRDEAIRIALEARSR